MGEIGEVVERINIIILNMSAKQRVLNKLESNIFKMNIYNEYINSLIEINIDLMELEENKKQQYKDLIDLYFEKSGIEDLDILEILTL